MRFLIELNYQHGYGFCFTECNDKAIELFGGRENLRRIIYLKEAFPTIPNAIINLL